MNLETLQKPSRGNGNGGGSIPVLFFTQLLGLALGESARDMDLHRSLLPLGERLAALAGAGS
jgi:heterodisulfide reductase subunit B